MVLKAFRILDDRDIIHVRILGIMTGIRSINKSSNIRSGDFHTGLYSYAFLLLLFMVSDVQCLRRWPFWSKLKIASTNSSGSTQSEYNWPGRVWFRKYRVFNKRNFSFGFNRRLYRFYGIVQSVAPNSHDTWSGRFTSWTIGKPIRGFRWGPNDA